MRDARLKPVTRGSLLAWTLKQVQGDDLVSRVWAGRNIKQTRNSKNHD
jgi:hypothetical protein